MKHIVKDYIPFEKFTIIDDVDKINESMQSEVNASKGAILAIVKGPHFVPNGISRNHRNYKDVWEKAGLDEEVQRKLRDNQMFGTIGHDVELTDKEIRERLYSHITRNINWETGEAESVIYNTPVGESLLTLLRAGTKLYVSSRADGEYKGKDEDGNDIMDPDTYKLERFDFVTDPGFLEAHPALVTESLQKDEEKVKEDVAQSLLTVARDTKAVLSLPMGAGGNGQFLVESVDGDNVELSNIDTGLSEHCTLGDFTDVTGDIQRSIKESFEGLQKELNDANESLKTLRFANKQGLNEAYVRERIAQGATYEAIERERPAARPYTISGVKQINESRDKGDEPFVSRLFG